MIVVGVDGSAGSDAALRWAAGEARLHGSGLRIVHVYHLPHVPLTEVGVGAAAGMALPAAFTEDDERLRRMVEAQARRVIDDALGRAGEAVAGLDVERVAAEGPPAQTLIESARGADMLVVGSRGRGGFLGLLLGSVSHQCAHHPPCPVVILPPPPEEGGPAAPG